MNSDVKGTQMPPDKGILWLLLFLLVPLYSVASTEVSGVIQDNTTWTKAGSPYNISGAVLIKYNATLYIEPGVLVVGDRFGEGDPTLEVEGKLHIAGTNDNFVEVRSLGIVTIGPNPLIDISYAELSGPANSQQRNIAAREGRIAIRDSRFIAGDGYAPTGITIYERVVEASIERNFFSLGSFRGQRNRFLGFLELNGNMWGDIYIRNNYFQALATDSRNAIWIEDVLGKWDHCNRAYPPREKPACKEGPPNTVIEYNSFSEEFLPTRGVDLFNASSFVIQHRDWWEINATQNYWGTTDGQLISQMINEASSGVTRTRYMPVLSDHHPDTNRGLPSGIVYLQTTSASKNISYTDIINSSDREQAFVGNLVGSDGLAENLTRYKRTMSLSGSVPPMGRLSLSSADLEAIFNLDPWQGPAILRVQGESSFDLMSKLINPSGLVSNTNCVRKDRVLNIEGFDSNNMTYVRLINTFARESGQIIGSLYDSAGNSVGFETFTLAENLAPYEQVWINRNELADMVRAEWIGEALLEVKGPRHHPKPGVKLLNLNYITSEETFFNFSCFEGSSSGRVYLQTTSTSQNISLTHLVNTSDTEQQLTGTLYGSDGAQVGEANQPLHSGTIPSKGRIIISSEDIETAFKISPWSGPAMLEVNGTDSFELMTKLTSPSGLISNTNCVREGQVHNIGGFDQTDVTYVRFINIGDEPITSIRGSLYNDAGSVVGQTNPVLIEELPAKGQVWRNRNQLSDIAGDTWNGTASLKIDNADDNLRLLNLNFINNETFFNFSCYESGQ